MEHNSQNPHDFNTSLSRLRELLHAQPNPQRWETLWRMFLDSPRDDGWHVAFQYATEHLHLWHQSDPKGPWSPSELRRLVHWMAELPGTIWHMHTIHGDPEHCCIWFENGICFKYAIIDEVVVPGSTITPPLEDFIHSGVSRWAIDRGVLALVWNKEPYTDSFRLPEETCQRLEGKQGLDNADIVFRMVQPGPS